MSDALKGIAAIILAAGKGTRMRSDLVKVLHPLLGVPMLSYTVDLALDGIEAEKTAVVVGHQADRIQDHFKDRSVQFVLQKEQLGTGHAVLQTLPFLGAFEGAVLILCGDVPLVKVDTLRSFIDSFRVNRPALAVMTVAVEDPFGYGRILHDRDGWLERIVEEKDATADERKIREINTGIYCIDAAFLRKGLQGIGRENAQGEYYLTDLVHIARGKGLKCSAYPVKDPVEVMGINTRVDLAIAHEVLRQEKMKTMMLSGVTVVDPRTTYVDQRVEVGKDTVLYPNCLLQGRTRIGERCIVESNTVISDTTVGNEVTIRSSSVIEESKIEDRAIIGPFAHLRPLSEIRTKAKIGNFVEVKKSVVGKGTKANHLAYIGDSTLGENVNMGAGSIICNYDGFEKHRTIIGDRVFVGSNVELVAPLKVGSDASIGAGTTVTKDVPDGALAISRAPQKNIKDWNKKVKLRRERLKKEKG